MLAVLNSVDVSVEDGVLTGASRPTISRAQHLNTHTVNTMVNTTLWINRKAAHASSRDEPEKSDITAFYGNTVMFMCFYCHRCAKFMRQDPETLHLNLNTGSTEPAGKAKAMGG